MASTGCASRDDRTVGALLAMHGAADPCSLRRTVKLVFPTGPYLCSTSRVLSRIFSTLHRAIVRPTRTLARARTHRFAAFAAFRALAAAFAAPLLAAPASAEPILLRPARVFDGVDPRPHEGWSVMVDGDR